MADDFLHQPLGQASKPGRRPLKAFVWAIGGLVALAILGSGLALRLRSTPSAEPAGAVVAAIGPVQPSPAPPPAPTADPPRSVLSAGDVEATSSVNVVRPPGSAQAGAQILKVPQDMNVSLQPAPDARLTEPSRFGLLPKRGSDGSRPAEIYARPVMTDSGLPANAPRIALMVGGMGLNAALTTRSVHDLPTAVTLGFAPYGSDLDRQVAAARDAGHEVVLQVPMEGFGDPPSATMSHLLSTGLEGKDLLDRLHWHMGRFAGYAGVSNFLGGKFMADDASVDPVVRDIAGRGLFFLEDGSSPHSTMPGAASAAALPYVHADLVLDANPDPAAMEAAMNRLVVRARESGAAVGIASGLPATVGRIAAFAGKLADQGISLVPVSAFATVPRASGLARQP